MSQKLLDGRYSAACIQELGGRGVAQAVRIDLYTHALSNSLEVSRHQILAQGLVAIEKEVIGGSRSAHLPIVSNCPNRGVGHANNCLSLIEQGQWRNTVTKWVLNSQILIS